MACPSKCRRLSAVIAALKLLASAGQRFEPVNGGSGQACRGSDPDDESRTYHMDYMGVPSLEDCKDVCRRAPICMGIEYGAEERICKVWTRVVGSSAAVDRQTCLRYGGTTPLRRKLMYMNNITAPQTYRSGFRYPRSDARLHHGDEVQLSSTSHNTWLHFQPLGPGKTGLRMVGQTTDPRKAATFAISRADVRAPAVALRCMNEGQGFYLSVRRSDGAVGCLSTVPVTFNYFRIDGQKWWDVAKGAFQDPQTKRYLRMESPDLGNGNVSVAGVDASGWQLFSVLLTAGYETVRPIMRGVNLGNWFLLERWMSSSLFQDANGTEFTDRCAALDEYGLMQRLPPGIRRARMESHWSSWIVEEDIRWLSRSGINTVRVPFGYWMTHPEEPFISGQFSYLQRLFVWCEKYSVAVLLDFHGLKGSQNGDSTSGNCGACGQEGCGETLQNFLQQQERNLAVIANLSAHFSSSPVYLGFGVANEVGSGDSHEVMAFYQKAYDVVRTHSSEALVFLGSTFNPSTYPFQGERGMVQDEHMYFSVISKHGAVADQAMNVAKAIEWLKAKIRWPVLVGEWSLNHHAFDYQGMAPAERDQWHKDFANAQLQVYEQHTMGWIYWTYKIEGNSSSWSFRDMCEKGWLPGCVAGSGYSTTDWWSNHPWAFAYLHREQQTADLPHDDGKVAYVATEVSTNHCPAGTSSLSESQCRSVPKSFGGELNDPFVVHYAEDPKGCFTFHNLYFYNTHSTGSSRTDRIPYCGRELTCDLEYVVSTSGSNACPQGTVALNESECRGAPGEFGGAWHNPFLVTSHADPAGCFRFGDRFYFNAHPHGSGRLDRVPLCKRSCVLEYVVSSQGSNSCPPGTAALSESECRGVPRQFGGLPHEPFVVDYKDDPRGCFRFPAAGFFYNRHAVGSPRRGRTPYCKQAYPAAYTLGDLGDNTCPEGAVLVSQSECRAAVKVFGGKLHTPFVVHSASDPKGCFSFLNSGEYVYNTHPSGSRNEGRTPLCKPAYDIEYVLGFDGNHDCPQNSVVLSKTECLRLPKAFGIGSLGSPFVLWSSSDPAGCFRFREYGYYYNTHPVGRGRKGRIPHCKRVRGADYVRGAAGDAGCATGTAPLSELECRSLPLTFHKLLHSPFVMDSPEDPRGCFGFRGRRYYNKHPDGKGRDGRTPYCKQVTKLLAE